MYSIFALTREGTITLDFEDKTAAIEAYWQVKKAVGLNVEFYTVKDDKTLKPMLDNDTFVWNELSEDKLGFYMHKAWFKLRVVHSYTGDWQILISKGQNSDVLMVDFVCTKLDAVSNVCIKTHHIADIYKLNNMFCYSESAK